MCSSVDIPIDVKHIICIPTYKRLDYTSKIANHFMFNIQHNWGHLYQHSLSYIISFLEIIWEMNEIFMWAPKFIRKMATNKIWEHTIIFTNCMVTTYMKVGAKLNKSACLKPFLSSCCFYIDACSQMMLGLCKKKRSCVWTTDRKNQWLVSDRLVEFEK